jgi:hypothetical protein
VDKVQTELHKIIQSHRPNVKKPDPLSHTKVVRMLYDNRKWIFDGEDDGYNDWERRCSISYTDFDYTPPKFTVRNPELRHPSVIGSYGQLDVKVSTKLSEQYYKYPHVTGLLLCCNNIQYMHLFQFQVSKVIIQSPWKGGAILNDEIYRRLEWSEL